MEYATLADFRAYSETPGASLSARELRSASLLVVDATRHAVYDTDRVTGLPTNQVVRDALRDATCEVLVHREDAKVSTALQKAGLKSASLGSGSYTVADTAGGTDPDALPVDAWRILAGAGLTGGPVQVVG